MMRTSSMRPHSEEQQRSLHRCADVACAHMCMCMQASSRRASCRVRGDRACSTRRTLFPPGPAVPADAHFHTAACTSKVLCWFQVDAHRAEIRCEHACVSTGTLWRGHPSSTQFAGVLYTVTTASCTVMRVLSTARTQQSEDLRQMITIFQPRSMDFLTGFQTGLSTRQPQPGDELEQLSCKNIKNTAAISFTEA
jgi:hypothetical protein